LNILISSLFKDIYWTIALHWVDASQQSTPLKLSNRTSVIMAQSFDKSFYVCGFCNVKFDCSKMFDYEHRCPLDRQQIPAAPTQANSPPIERCPCEGFIIKTTDNHYHFTCGKASCARSFKPFWFSDFQIFRFVWFYDFMILWFYDFMILWFYDFMILWFCDFFYLFFDFLILLCF
jgi:hypothetical protein